MRALEIGFCCRNENLAHRGDNLVKTGSTKCLAIIRLRQFRRIDVFYALDNVSDTGEKHGNASLIVYTGYFGFRYKNNLFQSEMRHAIIDTHSEKDVNC